MRPEPFRHQEVRRERVNALLTKERGAARTWCHNGADDFRKGLLVGLGNHAKTKLAPAHLGAGNLEAVVRLIEIVGRVRGPQRQYRIDRLVEDARAGLIELAEQ